MRPVIVPLPEGEELLDQPMSGRRLGTATWLIPWHNAQPQKEFISHGHLLAFPRRSEDGDR